MTISGDQTVTATGPRGSSTVKGMGVALGLSAGTVQAADYSVLAIDEANKTQELGSGHSIKSIVADDASDRNQAIALKTPLMSTPHSLDDQRVAGYGMNVLQVKGGQFVLAP